MKKSIFISCLFFLITVIDISAQEEPAATVPAAQPQAETQQPLNNNRNFPMKEDIGFTLNLAGLINNISLGNIKDFGGNDILMMRYFMKDDISLRLGFGMNVQNKKISKVDSILTAGAAQQVQDSSYKKADVFFAPGIEKHFFRGKRLDPYIGGNIEFGKLGRTKIRNIVAITDTIGTATTELNYQKDGGASFGINFISGFNFFFSEKLSIGAEYGLGFRTFADGGNWRSTTITTPVSGSPTSANQAGTDITVNTGLKVNSTAGITLSYFF